MKVLQASKNCMGIYRTTATGLIIDACDYYRAFYLAARKARRHILLAGWQFDSEVSLLRGEDLDNPIQEVRFLHFLETLCDANPELRIYILAWDFSMWFTLEREWFQDILFNWTTSERIQFRYDNKHALGATHHQKLVIVDGEIAFVGGMDICSDRWDDRRHQLNNPFRNDANGPYGSYHDIQSYHTGPVVAELTALFEQRWRDSGAPALHLKPANGSMGLELPGLITLQTNSVAISRTQAANTTPPLQEIQEIRNLFVAAIESAEHLIYLENQYFSSQALYRALVTRMRQTSRPRLQIIIILPDRLPFTEELFLGLPQMKMLKALDRVAVDTGHKLCVYSTICNKQGERKLTFIHSKLLLVDDLFLSIGSANLTNRSMGLDTELNVTWEAADEQDPLIESISRVRCSLLAEHTGLYDTGKDYRFKSFEGLTEYLDELADAPDSRLCRYAPDPVLEKSTWSDALEPISRVVDPEEHVFEQLTKYRLNVFAKGIRLLGQWIAGL